VCFVIVVCRGLVFVLGKLGSKRNLCLVWLLVKVKVWAAWRDISYFNASCILLHNKGICGFCLWLPCLVLLIYFCNSALFLGRSKHVSALETFFVEWRHLRAIEVSSSSYMDLKLL
jgi:hypothetical protein